MSTKKQSYLFIFICVLLSGSLHGADKSPFQIYCDSLKELCALAKFEEAELLIPILDSLAGIQQSPEKQADLLTYKGYYSMFRFGDEDSYVLLTKAAQIYDQENLTEKRNLAEAYLCVSLYLMKRLDASLQASLKILETVSPEEEETRGFAHNIAAAVYGSGGIGDPHKSIYHIRQALPYYKKIKDYRRLISLYGIMTACYNNLELPERALTFIDSTAYYAQLTNNQSQLAFLNIRRGRAYYNLKKYNKSITILKETEQYYLKNGSEHRELDWIYGLLRNYHIRVGDEEEALKYALIRDSLMVIERESFNDKNVNDLMVKYETEKKEHQIQLQTLTIENQQHRHRQLVISSIGGLVFLLLLLGFGYFYFLHRQKEKLRLTQIQYQKELLEATVNTQEPERKRIARDLHDGIGQQLSGLKLGFQQLCEKIEAKILLQNGQLKKLNNILNNAATDVRNLSHQMMPKALQELGLVSAVEDMLDNSFSLTKTKCQFEHLGMEERLPEMIEIGLYRIAQELINNILKHAEAKEVDVTLVRRKNQILFIVEDDGKGFQLDKTHRDGHGFTNIRSRLQAIKGEVHYESGQGEGTVVTIRVNIVAI